HRTYIETIERAREPQRADRLASALAACRKSAQKGELLTFERLAVWQAIVLGEPTAPPWRTTDAFARHVRYAYATDLPVRFDVALAEANGSDPPHVRAARVYLDVAFFHPFGDGNARAARLALDHVLTRAGLGLAAIEPVILLERAGDDSSGAYWLSRMIDQLAGPLA
ncbi:MAG TPA: Fic family protein, partial [Kofleriaceae bacterium]